jgi:cobalt-precorrin-6B (C15)-methyltransferase
MSADTIPGGPTQDEILAISLFKLGIRQGDLVLDCGCGTGKVALAMAQRAGSVVALDRRKEAIRFARKQAQESGSTNIEFLHQETAEFLGTDERIFDCAFVGGSYGLTGFLPVLAQRVRRRIVVNAVLVSTLAAAVSSMQDLGIFEEVVQIQASRSHELAGSFMFRPIDPVYIIVGKGGAC